ncbi:MAG: 2-oxo-4-hydroxy-4-carboxy-5-ureidoimidazoline decarboxylase [Ancalomicrobiaceae bacterium]|nr:2-oxo-4-hydroxy-4-carboxy-5-ureidoimidazoline decarboxylase [Ancalomicrobiaceae bacterium]
MTRLTTAAVNGLTDAEFVDRFGDIAEHSPWVAERAARARPYADREAFIAGFVAALESAPEEARLALIRAHPDLAGKAAIRGDLTDDSTREQAGAGLGSLTPAEYARFSDLNADYKRRFGIPFIFAVKGATKDMILAAFETRIDNDYDVEFATALGQVCRIFRFRIEDRVSP